MDVLNDVEDFINSSKDLPSLPEVIIELNKLLAKPDIDIRNLSKVVETEMAISTSILVMANSPFYRGLSEIKSIRDGIMRIGLKETKNLIYSKSLMPLFTNIKDIDPNNFWKHAIFTAHTAEILGEMIKYKGDLSQLYTSGLLHDIGILVLAKFFSSELEKILKNTIDSNGILNHGFFEVFNNMHSEVGGMLLKRWNLPENIVQCALFHHYPEQASDEYLKEVKIIRMANEITILEEHSYFKKIDINTYPFSIHYNSKKITELREKAREKILEIGGISSIMGVK